MIKMNLEKGFDRIAKAISHTIGFCLFLFFLKFAVISNTFNMQIFSKFFLLGIAAYLVAFAFIYLPFIAIMASVKWIYEGFLE